MKYAMELQTADQIAKGYHAAGMTYEQVEAEVAKYYAKTLTARRILEAFRRAA